MRRKNVLFTILLVIAVPVGLAAKNETVLDTPSINLNETVVERTGSINGTLIEAENGTDSRLKDRMQSQDELENTTRPKKKFISGKGNILINVNGNSNELKFGKPMCGYPNCENHRSNQGYHRSMQPYGGRYQSTYNEQSSKYHQEEAEGMPTININVPPQNPGYNNYPPPIVVDQAQPVYVQSPYPHYAYERPGRVQIVQDMSKQNEEFYKQKLELELLKKEKEQKEKEKYELTDEGENIVNDDQDRNPGVLGGLVNAAVNVITAPVRAIHGIVKRPRVECQPYSSHGCNK